MDGVAVGREVAEVREQQAAAIGQRDEALARGAAERLLADEIGAIVVVERGGEHFRRAGGALVRRAARRAR